MFSACNAKHGGRVGGDVHRGKCHRERERDTETQ